MAIGAWAGIGSENVRISARESFVGSSRDECFNVHWFESMEEAKERIEAWRIDYNESRPHQALREETPAEFALRTKQLEQSRSEKSAGD